MLNYYRYPCSHAVLENVFAKELGKIAKTVWLFQGESNTTASFLKWHNSYIIFCKKLPGENLISTIFNKVLMWNKLFVSIHYLFSGRIDIIFIRDLPLYAILIGPLRYFRKFKLYFQYSAPQGDISIRYAGNVSGFKRYWHLLKGYAFNLIIHRALKTSDLIFTISDFHKNRLSKTVEVNKMVPITMGVDSEWIESKGRKIDCIQKLKNNNKLITYFGSLSFTRNPQFIIKVFAKVKQKYKNCKMILIGTGTYPREENTLLELSKELGVLDDIVFVGRVSRQVVRDYLSYSDLTISAIPPDSHFQISSPTKLYESLGCGVPVVANLEIYEQEKVVKESKAGMLVRYVVDDFCNAIVNLLSSPSLINEMSNRGESYIKDKYTYKEIAKKLTLYFS